MKDHNAPITRRGMLPDDLDRTLSTPRILFPKKDAVLVVREWFKESKDPDIWVFGKSFDKDLVAWLEEPSQAREFTSDFWNLPARRKELDKETSEIDRQHVQALRWLRHAYTDSVDESKARDILNKVQKMCSFPEILSNDPSWSSNKARVRLLYPLIFGDALKQARVRMWPTGDGAFVPVIWCDNMTGAMFAHAAFNGVEACQNCGKLFCTDRPRIDGSRAEKFCTVACGQRLRQRMYRKRKSKEVKRKSR